MIANSIGGYLGGGGNAFTNWAKGDIFGAFTAGALTGAVAGAISSAVYGGNWGKNMLQGAQAGVIGAGVAIAAAFGFSVIKELTQDLVAGLGGAARITYETIDAAGKTHTYKEKWNPPSVDNNPFGIMLDNVIAKNETITFFEYVGHGLDGDLFYGESMLGKSQIYSNLDGFKSKILQAFSKQAIIEFEACYSASCSKGSVASELKKLLPESRVLGYTGKAKPFLFFGCGWETYRWVNSKWVEVE